MSEILLQTKISVPPRRPLWLPRIRLSEKATQGLSGKLILISAPAGYGKTSFAVDWLHQLAAGQTAWSGSRKGWVSLDETDNDPVTFMLYLIAAIRRAVGDETWGERVQVMIQSTNTTNLAAVSLLLNEIVQLDASLILVLDDYHLIHHDAIHQMVATLLDHQPANLKLVFLTRAAPPLPLARMRLRGELTELQTADLRFSPAETAEFFRRAREINLTPEQVAALDAQAEGWAAGLQAVTMSLQVGQDVAQFLETFQGRQRFVFDYLVEEVYRQQPDAIQMFLRQTAVCEIFCAPLCEVLLDKETWAQAAATLSPRQTEVPASAQSVLAYLDAANLFVVPLDDQRRWYRYHTLFRDFLQGRLIQKEPEQLPSLHRRAAAWMAQNGLIDEAIRHWLAAGDDQAAVDLIAIHARSKITRGEGVTLQRWLDALPADRVRSDPRLALAQATVLTFVRDIEGVENYLQAAEMAVAESPQLPPAETEHLLGGVAVYRAMIALWQGHTKRTILLCQDALQRLQGQDSYLTGLASLLLGVTMQTNDLQQAGASFAVAMAVGQKTGDMMLVNTAAGNMATIHVAQGKLHQAADLYREAITLATDAQGRPLPVAAGAFIGLAQIATEWNMLDQAANYLDQAIGLAEDANLPDISLEARITQVWLQWSQQGPTTALKTLASVESEANSQSRPDIVQRLAALRARIDLARGDLAAAGQWARECGLRPDEITATVDEERALILARVMIAQTQTQTSPLMLTQTMQMLSLMETRATAHGRVNSQIAILVLRALAHDAQGAEAEALAVLTQAIALAETGRYVRLFANEGELMLKYLPQLARTAVGPTVDYVGILRGAIEQAPTANDQLIEPLTEREMDVLKLIVIGMSNQEIADTLVIAVSTVKRHINHIYGKLEVSNRAQAIAQAHVLNLFSD